MTSDATRFAIHKFGSSEGERASLKAISEAWGEAFWRYGDIERAIALKTNEILYIKDEHDPMLWLGLVMIDLSTYNSELLYVYVRPQNRGQGLGSQLIGALIDDLYQNTQAETLFLEVRRSNIGAQKLYNAHGFEQVGERKKYYSDGEDALVYRYLVRPVENK